MRRTVLSIAICATLASAVSTALTSNSEPSLSCLTPGGFGLARIQDIKENLVETDSGSVRWRTGFGVDGTDSAAVYVVTDTLICTRITQVVDSVFEVPTTTSPYLLVIRVGPRYVAFEDNGPSMFFVDTNFIFKNVIP